MLRFLLDTNIVIYVLKRRPIEVLSVFNANASRMAISSITLAALMHGAEKSSRVAENLAVIEDFCSRLEVLPYGPKAAQHCGAIRAALEKLGRPIGVNDLHIAATPAVRDWCWSRTTPRSSIGCLPWSLRTG